MSNNEYSKKYNKYQLKFMLSTDKDKKNFYQQKMNYYSVMSGGNVTDSYFQVLHDLNNRNPDIDSDIEKNKRSIEDNFNNLKTRNEQFIQDSFNRTKKYAVELSNSKGSLVDFYKKINDMIVGSAKDFDLVALDNANTIRHIADTINDGVNKGDKTKVLNELLVISRLKYDETSAKVLKEYLEKENALKNYLGNDEDAIRIFESALMALSNNIENKAGITQVVPPAEVIKNIEKSNEEKNIEETKEMIKENKEAQPENKSAQLENKE